MDMYIIQLVEEAFKNANYLIILLLLAIGWLLKHVVEKLPNKYIPPILIVVGLVATFIQLGISVESAVSGIVSCVIAIGIHQTGKNIFTVSVIPAILEKLNFNKETE